MGTEALATPAAYDDLNDDSIREVARNCGQLAVGCSDAAGHVAGVSQGIAQQLDALADLEGVTAALEIDQRAVAVSTNEARNLFKQARTTLDRESCLEDLSNTMLDRLAHSGAQIDDTRFVAMTIDAANEIRTLVERAIDAGEISAEDVFDTDYVPIAGTDPVQCAVRFNDFADAHIRPILGHGRYRPVKSVFVPLRIAGRRWGNFELAFTD